MSSQQPETQFPEQQAAPNPKKPRLPTPATKTSFHTDQVGGEQQNVFRIPQSPHSATAEVNSKTPKIAIPRLKRPSEGGIDTPGRGGNRHRVNHACEPCRHRKTKCSGEKPVCRHCQDFKIACFYADGKRDRVKKQFGTMSEKVAEYERILRDLRDRVSAEDASLIKASLDRALPSDTDDQQSEGMTLPSIELESEEESGAESEISAGMGSTGAIDRAEEDFTRENAIPSGFMGKNSDVAWLQRLKQENAFGDSPPEGADDEIQRLHQLTNESMDKKKEASGKGPSLSEAAGGFAVRDSSYHLDDVPISAFEAVDSYEMPPPETAKRLFMTYMRRVHPNFPIVGKTNLTAQFQRYISKPSGQAPRKWLAIINLMFAISARYSHLIQADWRGDERDHMVYCTRARQLALNDDALFSHPDLQLIQIAGLMSFYLLCSSQINRAWTLAGYAIRAATALGLNLRNDSTTLRDPLKEIRYRLWWSLYTLEHRIASITGRANCILDDHCTTPLPCPIEEEDFQTEEGRRALSKEMQKGSRSPIHNRCSPAVVVGTPAERESASSKSEQSQSPSTLYLPQAELDWAKDYPANSSLYFLHLVQLSRLTQTILQQLYNPVSNERSWSFVQTQIKTLGSQLEAWHQKLPPIYDFQRNQRDREHYEARLNLGFFYYGTKQMILRPCLCRLDRKAPNQSNKSHDFNRMMAAACVGTAQDTLRLIPDVPNAVGLMTAGPWWTILHWLVQAASVLMLEISFRAYHMPQKADSILESSKKAVRWLHALGHDNPSAKRAWRLCDSMLREAAAKAGRDVSDLPENALGGSSHSDGDSSSMSGIVGVHQPMMSQSHQPTSTTGLDYGDSFHGGHPSLGTYGNFMLYDQYYASNEALDVNYQASVDEYSHHQDMTDDTMEYVTNSLYDDRSAGHGGDRATRR